MEPSIRTKVTVWFNEPVPGFDPVTGDTFTSNRHIVMASVVERNLHETSLVDLNGEVVAAWPTDAIDRIVWAPTQPSSPVGSVEWREQVRAANPQAYERWTPEEDDLLRSERARGWTVDHIAASHARRPGGIRARLEKLGLAE
ncbi:MAG: hypothetical protein ACLPTB_15035 [Acidimicrobiales bacterium]|jgi:hypothetical protein